MTLTLGDIVMKTAIVLIVLAAALGICATAATQAPSGVPGDLPEEALEELEKAKDLIGEGGPEVGEMAPDFTLQGLNGAKVTLSDLRGSSPVVLLFGSCT